MPAKERSAAARQPGAEAAFGIEQDPASQIHRICNF